MAADAEWDVAAVGIVITSRGDNPRSLIWTSDGRRKGAPGLGAAMVVLMLTELLGSCQAEAEAEAAKMMALMRPPACTTGRWLQELTFKVVRAPQCSYQCSVRPLR